jgi:hypothetical protein
LEARLARPAKSLLQLSRLRRGVQVRLCQEVLGILLGQGAA